MADVEQKPQKVKTRTSCFPSCFGTGTEISRDPSPDEDLNKAPDDARHRSRKKLRWFSRFEVKKPGKKTVPVDATVSEVIKEIDMIPGKSQSPDTADCRPSLEAVASDPNVTKKPQKKAKYGTAQSSILEVRDELDHLASAKSATCRKRSPAGQNPKPQMNGGGGTGRPCSREKKLLSNQKLRTLHCSSFPPPNRSKPVDKSASGGRHAGKILIQGTRGETGKLDAVVGFSVLVMILAIMLMWGRICAIVCTSAWLCFIPRLRTVPKADEVAGNGSCSGEVDVNSEEYKKKVILEGLLERNHRKVAGDL